MALNVKDGILFNDDNPWQDIYVLDNTETVVMRIYLGFDIITNGNVVLLDGNVEMFDINLIPLYLQQSRAPNGSVVNNKILTDVVTSQKYMVSYDSDLKVLLLKIIPDYTETKEYTKSNNWKLS